MWLLLLVGTCAAATSSTPTTDSLSCGSNERVVPCKNACPPSNCDISYTSYPPCDYTVTCVAGCDCIEDYLRTPDGECVPNEDCPPPTTEEVNSNPPSTSSDNLLTDQASCSSSRSTSSSSSSSASTSSSSSSTSSTKRSRSNKSGSEDENSSTTTTVQPPTGEQCGVNETSVECSSLGCPTNYCPVSDSRAIVACSVAYPCPPGCDCKFNYRRKSFDEPNCILAEECPPINCTRPNEEYNPCASSCLAETCQDVAYDGVPCNEFVRSCQPKCVCTKGYFRDDSDTCVPKDECPKPECGENEQYVNCKVECPNDYCALDDSRAILICDPGYPCPGGCVCKLNYQRRSQDDPTCILASDCPPVNCTRPNEIWDSCPSPCLAESCDSVNDQPTTCNYLVQNCQPRCVCEKGFFRSTTDDICIAAAECQASQIDK